MLLFFTVKETGHSEKKFPGAKQDPTTNSNYIWHRAGSKLGGAKFVVCERSRHCTIPAPCIDIGSKLSNYLSANLLVESNIENFV